MNALTIQSAQAQLSALTPEFAKTLPPGITADRFARVALTAMQNNPNLLRCEPQSLFNACMKAAQDGLLPDGREGAIVPRGAQATWQPMVFGIIAKAKRRGSVTNLVANIVYEGEPFEVLMGDEDRIMHRRDIAAVQKGSEVAVYAIATLKDGTKEREVMTWEEVQAVRRMSATPNTGPWVTMEGEMARKTVIRRLSKRLPSLDDGDDELRQAIESVDELYPFGKNKPQPPIIDAQPEPARPGGMVEVARAVAAEPAAAKKETLRQVGERLMAEFAQAQSLAGMTAIDERADTKRLFAKFPESGEANAVRKARDAAYERLAGNVDDSNPTSEEEHAMFAEGERMEV